MLEGVVARVAGRDSAMAAEIASSGQIEMSSGQADDQIRSEWAENVRLVYLDHVTVGVL
jgi:hypothetical protein